MVGAPAFRLRISFFGGGASVIGSGACGDLNGGTSSFSVAGSTTSALGAGSEVRVQLDQREASVTLGYSASFQQEPVAQPDRESAEQF